MKPTYSIASDYATVSSKYFNAYYGYEITDEYGDWCFEAEFSGVKITIPASKLNIKELYNAEEGLLKGIAWVFMAYEINPERLA